ncbi:hypothetical protein C8Q74DRAFT_316493 [Fomes fomentarius]|nr:hypothetical protein C8Q74DRAFT_316493 [Fomes fomentarius]
MSWKSERLSTRAINPAPAAFLTSRSRCWKIKTSPRSLHVCTLTPSSSLEFTCPPPHPSPSLTSNASTPFMESATSVPQAPKVAAVVFSLSTSPRSATSMWSNIYCT